MEGGFNPRVKVPRAEVPGGENEGAGGNTPATAAAIENKRWERACLKLFFGGLC